MRRTTFFISVFVLQGLLFANTGFIDLSKISRESKLVSAFKYINDHRPYFDHWTHDWTYDKPKNELAKKLRSYYTLFEENGGKTEECFLLLGDIAHYLYNLEDSAYYRLAVKNYQAALQINQSFRGFWFLANHYALANQPVEGMDCFEKAKALLPAQQPAEFWNNYARAAMFAGMPSHCLYAMNEVRRITGAMGEFETQQGHTVYANMRGMDRMGTYDKNELWQIEPGGTATLTSRPLGTQIQLDTTWHFNCFEYGAGGSAIIINPPRLKNKAGREIGYSIAVMFRAGEENEQIEDYIARLMPRLSVRNRIEHKLKYEKAIAYELIDKTLYEDRGGGHMRLIVVERGRPQYPGWLFERPRVMAKEKGLSYYTPQPINDRFKGKYFYAIMLDTCEDIYEGSLAAFNKFVEQGLLIE
jgi:tetratricopeptide (TPR) repeat protein